jgi:hypothetical protein
MHSFRFLRAALAGALVLAASTARAGDLDGLYESTGTVVSANPATAEAVSFHGLLELNFDHVLARAQHSETERVTIQETATRFKIQCLDGEDKVTWTGSWEKGDGCTVTDGRVDLTFHNAKLKYDSYVLTLQTVPGRDLILVEAKRINATPLGPSVQPEGTFVFGRLSKR